MRIDCPPRGENHEVPAWPFVGFSLALLAGLGWCVSLLPARFLPPCGFHRLTGHPCPTCGATRAGFLLLHGRVGAALAVNPLFTLFLLLLACWVAVGALSWLLGRSLFIRIPPKEQSRWWLLLLVLFLANWIYLWEAGI